MIRSGSWDEDPVEGSRVVVAGDVLDAQGERWLDEDGELDGWTTSPVFFVAPGDSDAAVEAVVAAAVRFLTINEHGREIADREQGSGFYTPGYVAVLRSDAGIALVTDTDGDLAREQGEAMVALRAEARLPPVGEPTNVWMPVDPAYVPWPLPPHDIRDPG